MNTQVAPIRKEAVALRRLVESEIPVGMQDTWVSASAWFWLKTNGPGVGGGAQAYDEFGHAGGFSFDLRPAIQHL